MRGTKSTSSPTDGPDAYLSGPTVCRACIANRVRPNEKHTRVFVRSCHCGGTRAVYSLYLRGSSCGRRVVSDAVYEQRCSRRHVYPADCGLCGALDTSWEHLFWYRSIGRPPEVLRDFILDGASFLLLLECIDLYVQELVCEWARDTEGSQAPLKPQAAAIT